MKVEEKQHRKVSNEVFFKCSTDGVTITKSKRKKEKTRFFMNT